MIPVEGLAFALCTFLGGGMLLIAVIAGERWSAVVDLGSGGVPARPLLLAFVSLFGVGGLFATQVFDVHGGQAAIAGTGFGVVGMGVAYLLFGLVSRAEAVEPFPIQDLVGDEAVVVMAIPAGRSGSIQVNKDGKAHEVPASGSADVAAGTTVRVIGVSGSGLVVEAVAPDERGQV